MSYFTGVVFVVLSSIGFGVMATFAKAAYSEGMDALTLLFFRFFFAALFLLAYILFKKIKLKLKKRQAVYILILGIFGYSFTGLTLFLSYNYMSTGMATTIHFLFPAIVTIASFVIYKEKPSNRKVISLILSILGLFILVGGKGGINITGLVLSFTSAVLYSIYILGVSNKIIKKMNTFVSTFYICLIASMALLIIKVFLNTPVVITQKSFSMALLIAFFSTTIPLLLFTRGILIIGPSSASILSTMEPIMSVILGVIVLKEEFTISIAIGIGLILSSVFLLSTNKS